MAAVRVATGLVAVAPAGSIDAEVAGAPTRSCASPLPAIYASHRDTDASPVVQDFPATPVAAPPVDGPSLTSDWASNDVDIDTDGDGKADRIGDRKDGIAIERGDGTVHLLTPPGFDVVLYDYDGTARFRPGDLDGDGHDDLLLYASGSGESGQWYALSGATATGTHPLADVAVELPAQQLYVDPGKTAILGAVSDQVGGPGADFLVRDTADSGLVAGDALLAPGPGSKLERFPVAVSLPGELRGEFDLGGDRPALLLAEGDYFQGVIGLRIWKDGRLHDIEAFGGSGFLAYETFDAVSSPIGDLLVATTSDRSGGQSTTVWNLSALCGGTGTGGASAPPAAPVSAEPSFTG